MTNPENKPRANNRKLRLILRVLMVLCAAGLLYSAATLIAGNREYVRGDAVYDQIRQLQTERQGTDPADPTSDTLSYSEWVDFAALAQTNPDIVAWLTEEDGIIDYPVVQGTDNHHYLTHLFNGERNKLGCLFVDYRLNGDFSNKNTAIYGHNMKDGSMFASLTNYQEQSYYESRPAMRLYTPKGAYVIELFAGIVADGSDEFIRFGFHDSADFLAYIDALKADSTFQSDVTVGVQDRIVTLSTCSDDFNNARYALFGKLTAVAEP